MVYTAPEPSPVAGTRGGCANTLGSLLVLAWYAAVPSAVALAATGAAGADALKGAAALPWLPLALAAQLVLLLPIAYFARRQYAGLSAVAWLMSGAAVFAFCFSAAGLLLPSGDMRGPSLALGAGLLAGAVLVLAALGLAYRALGLTRGAWLDAMGWGVPLEPALLVALSVAALLLPPWLLTGSLGDPRVTLAVALSVLASALGIETLFRGIGWSLLRDAFPSARQAGLFSVLAFMAYVAGGVLPAGQWSMLFAAVLAAAVGLLLAALRAGGRSAWPAVLVQFVYSGAGLLFVDPRTYEDVYGLSLPNNLAQALAWLSMPLVALAAGVVLLLLARASGSGMPAALRWGGAGVIALALWVLAGGVWAAGGEPGFHPDGFIVVLKEQADLSANLPDEPAARRVEVRKRLLDAANRTQPPLLAELERRGLHYRRYYIVNAVRVDSDPELIAEFAARPEVAQAYLNPYLRPARVYWPVTGLLGAGSSDVAGVAPGIAAVGADQVWAQGVRGKGIVVAGADTGVDWTHPALKPHYRGWNGQAADHNYNWYDVWDDSPAPFDADGHGTHTVGTMVGSDGVHEVGMAPDAQWIACRNMRFGLGNPGAYMACMEFFLAPFPIGGDSFTDGRPELAPDVINNSWGCPPIEGCGPDTLRLATEHLRAGAVMMVVSAGNDGPQCSSLDQPDANYASVFTVGAVTDDGEIAGFSNRGPVTVGSDRALKPDVVAPGVNVRSTVPGGTFQQAGWAGTSMAGPHVAGLVALIWSANPALRGRIDETEQLIRTTARAEKVAACTIAPGSPLEAGLQVTSPACTCGGEPAGAVPNFTFGYGMIDAVKAVAAARAK